MNNLIPESFARDKKWQYVIFEKARIEIKGVKQGRHNLPVADLLF
ncbi:MAG: hypothetical protein NTW16_00080 [Bacteroidetes bacterium]|nr:hypothetical protein [Bacteroidota bacterium]